ncbi:toll/interleukin-1 receptor domain-containing protein [Massilia orientalis]|uniref:Toll/interleukin-1 receptor domain-containing protein n=1 Tax=Massilia orientalis TaxID=3050128 RepID=A0ACC7MFU6_9BURK|nr:toll/interleukin-1 receptor domain-containing protein [Massilia sp. YIM B02787]
MSIQNHMYNLLVSSNETAWTGTSWVMLFDRVFEHTNPHIKQQFDVLDDAALERLMALPTLFAYEQYVDAPARVGRITAIARRQQEFAITFNLDDAVEPIPREKLTQMLPALDITSKWEMTRTHWAVKNVDLAAVLHQAGLLPVATLGPLQRPPLVFISYSWDSPEHRAWVTQLAISLRQKGVEVVLDQWHTRFGEDLPHFMARSVRECDRVLMVCTEAYVDKAQQRQGGVGYEQMLVTAQMMREVGTRKFIPIVRQSVFPRRVPDELAGRKYVDLSDGPEQHHNLEQLVRELHDMEIPLPPLGRRPT